MKKLQIIALSLLAVAVSCGTTKSTTKSASPSADLEATSWQIVKLNGRSIETAEDNFMLRFEAENHLAATGSCNQIMGGYTQGNDGTITLDPAGMTRMACPDMKSEAEFVETLKGTTSYEVVGDNTLYLFHDDKVVATFTRK